MFVHLRQGQCRPALAVSGFDVFPSGLVPEQRSENLDIAILRSVHQCRPASIPGSEHHIDAVVFKKAYHSLQAYLI